MFASRKSVDTKTAVKSIDAAITASGIKARLRLALTVENLTIISSIATIIIKLHAQTR